MFKLWSYIKRHPILMLIFVLGFAYSGVTWVNQEIKLREYYAKEKACQEQISILKEEVEIARQDLDTISSTQSIEKLAREKLKMVRPNEIIYIIQEDKIEIDDIVASD